jgi:hypothetical protein
MNQPSRIAKARRNVRFARYAIGVTAAAALAAFAAAARVAHPGTHHSTRARAATGTATASVDESASESFFGDDSSSIGPSGSASPQIESGAS